MSQDAQKNIPISEGKFYSVWQADSLLMIIGFACVEKISGNNIHLITGFRWNGHRHTEVFEILSLKEIELDEPIFSRVQLRRKRQQRENENRLQPKKL
jgi:hypothetical protein